MAQKTTRTTTESFFWAVKWNLIEAVLYQCIFIAHQTALFSLAPRALFGTAGSLFGLVYVGVTLLVAGSDGALTPFFSDFNTTKERFISFLTLYYKRYFFILALIGVISISGIYQYQQFGKSYTTASNQLLIVLGLITLSEAIKKIVRYLLQLCFENKATTVYELIGISSYVSMVWGWYMYTPTFSLMSLFLPFLISSIMVNLLVIGRLFFYANSLPLGSSSDRVLHLPKSLTKTQILISLNQYGRTLFSGNVIIPLFALYAGAAQAGLASFANAVTHTATFFIQKLSVPPGAALLTRVQHEDQQKHHTALATILSVGHALALISSVGVLLYGLIKGPTSCGLTFETTFLFGFFFFIHILENLFMIYEKYFLIKHKTGLLVLLNGASLLLCCGVWLAKLPFFVFIMSCFCIRLGLLFLLNRLVFVQKYL